VNLGRILGREAEAIDFARTRMAGEGVSVEAQLIFDALSKTMPCHWDKSDIVVLDDVRITSPYSASNIVGNNVAANKLLIDRLKVILEGEKKRLQKDTPAKK